MDVVEVVVKKHNILNHIPPLLMGWVVEGKVDKKLRKFSDQNF